MTGLRTLQVASALFLGLASPALAAEPSCTGLTPPQAVPQGSERTITARDLATLRDLGPTAGMFLGQSPVGISPDGRHIAFQLRQADPDRNRFCLGMYVLDLAAGARPIVVDSGGELVRFHFTRGTLADYPSGEAQMITPRWSPDGRWIAFLKSTGGPTQVWVARTDGSGSHELTRSAVSVEDFAWTPDGRWVVVMTRPDFARQREAIEQEGRNGWHYDDRWSPVASNHPWPTKAIDTDYRLYDLADGSDRTASATERNAFGPPPDLTARAGASRPAIQGTNRAWFEPIAPKAIDPDDVLHVRLGDHAIECTAEACRGVFKGLWWSGQELVFLRAEGWGSSELGLYVWKPGSGAPRRTLSTSDLLLGCQLLQGRLLCAQEKSTTPRQLVWVDPHDGRRHLIFDPNPEFQRLKLGSVERLHWLNNRGLPVFGDLVLPPGYRGDHRLPAILVQYRTRGFLRGGTGDEFPIQLFAAHGFAVLSIDRPHNISSLTPAASEDAKVRIDYGGWNDKHSVLSAITSGFAYLERRGLIDPARIGITGLSDGSTTAQFALLNSPLFHAASLATCCEDPKTLMPLMGPYGDRYLFSYLYPGYTDDDEGFWGPYSMARNAKRFDTPLLLQLPDDEYLAGLENFASLSEQHKPVDLYVFPDEHHSKWQPAHRLAVYERNVDWFDFWLNGRRNSDPAKAEQYRRWDAMKMPIAPGKP